MIHCALPLAQYQSYKNEILKSIKRVLDKGCYILGPEVEEFEELIDIVEQEASSELYGLLKRPDEKFVTELAYDNPKFVEDMVRDIAVHLDKDERVMEYIVESENFESIHNHSAYAQIHNIKKD